MIRPAVITDEISQDFEHALDVMLEYGVVDAELRGLWGTNVVNLPPEGLDRARRALASRGMRVCSIASPLFKSTLSEDAISGAGGPGRVLKEQLSLLEHTAEVAGYFHTALVRIFSYWKQGDLTPGVTDAIVDSLAPAARRAGELDVVLGLENEYACFLGTGEETARVIGRIESPHLRAVWDPGNAFFAGERPYPDGYAAVREHVVHVHVKDAARGDDGKPRWTVVGEGEIDYRGQFAALVADGYEGAVSLETHYKPPSGSSEEGSRRCLEGMLRLLEAVGARRGPQVS